MGMSQIKFVRLVFAGIVVFWTAAVIAGYFIAGDYIRQSKFDLLKSAARSSMQKDIAYRHLFASLERIYVPRQTGIKANPFLDSRQKEIVTLDGQHLVQLNPAYITRLFYEMDSKENSGARVVLVSLKPLNPESAPDKWQEKGLKSFDYEMERLQKGRYDSICIVVCDVDGLKRVNDEHGHVEGDSLIKYAAENIAACLREGDLVARIGGDEFAVLITDADEQECCNIMGRIRARIARFNSKEVKSGLSLSMGCSHWAGLEPKNLQDLFKKADDLMYRDKRIKNRQRAE